MNYRFLFAMLMMTWMLQPLICHAQDDDRPLPEAISRSKQDLQKARENYQQAVHQYGKDSLQAQNAKNSLRQTRRSFHEQRRRLMPHHESQHPRGS